MTNKEIIESFYKAFQALDSKTMNSLLDENIVFEDPAFGKQKGERAKYMWQFLCENANDFKMSFSNIEADKKNGTAHWEAKYVFKTTGNKVHNIIESKFEFKNGLISKHKDNFDLKKWVKQAMGSAVGFIGGSFLMKKAVRSQSNKLLDKYIERNELL